LKFKAPAQPTPSPISFVARAFQPAGVLVAVIDYALIPTVDMDELVRQVRRIDTVGRYGGDELVVLLPEAAAIPAAAVAEKLRAAIERLGLGEPALSISIGVAVLPDHAEDPEALLGAADRALYAAKAAGRGRVFIAEHPAATHTG